MLNIRFSHRCWPGALMALAVTYAAHAGPAAPAAHPAQAEPTTRSPHQPQLWPERSPAGLAQATAAVLEPLLA